MSGVTDVDGHPLACGSPPLELCAALEIRRLYQPTRYPTALSTILGLTNPESDAARARARQVKALLEQAIAILGGA